MSWLGLEGKAAIVTGGASGIGRACVEALAEAGAKVVVADVDSDGATRAASEVEPAPPGEVVAAVVNVTDKGSVEAMIRTTLDAFGKLDILVNNAGINIPRLLVNPAGKEELTEAIWDKVVAVNQKGFFLCAQAAAREMLKAASAEGQAPSEARPALTGVGVIVNVASECGLEGSEGQSVYAATKAAAYSLTRSWAKELGRLGVRVVGVAPGILEATALRTDEYERALAYTRGITVDELRAEYESVTIPLGRVGRLRETADTVCFLASDRAGYVHGTVVNVSGGKSRG